jgi:hypothetical protein
MSDTCDSSTDHLEWASSGSDTDSGSDAESDSGSDSDAGINTVKFSLDHIVPSDPTEGVDACTLLRNIAVDVLDSDGSTHRYYCNSSEKNDSFCYRTVTEHYDATMESNRSVCQYKGKVKHGKEELYRADGSLSMTITWQNGIRHGYTKIYGPDGCKVLLAVPYSDGKICGTLHDFTLASYQRTPYVDGKPHGTSTWYNAEGLLMQVLEYEDGKKTTITSAWDMTMEDRIELSL